MITTQPKKLENRVPLTKSNQQPQQSSICNTFTSIELLPLSAMENQHKREKAKHKTINV